LGLAAARDTQEARSRLAVSRVWASAVEREAKAVLAVAVVSGPDGDRVVGPVNSVETGSGASSRVSPAYPADLPERADRFHKGDQAVVRDSSRAVVRVSSPADLPDSRVRVLVLARGVLKVLRSADRVRA
jgi:hypothetical protein